MTEQQKDPLPVLRGTTRVKYELMVIMLEGCNQGMDKAKHEIQRIIFKDRYPPHRELCKEALRRIAAFEKNRAKR